MGIPAVLNKKANGRSEDLLTSNIFQLVEYLPVDVGLLPIISKAKNIKGKRLINSLTQSTFDKVTSAEYIFWPRIEGKEPDLVIHLKNGDGIVVVIFIEAKLYSPKSSEAQQDEEGEHIARSDQLEAEYDIMNNYKKGFKCDTSFLIYLTADIDMPKDDIVKSEGLIGGPGSIYWLNYYTLDEVCKEQLKNIKNGTTKFRILSDLRRLFDHYSFILFYGWNCSKYHKMVKYQRIYEGENK